MRRVDLRQSRSDWLNSRISGALWDHLFPFSPDLFEGVGGRNGKTATPPNTADQALTFGAFLGMDDAQLRRGGCALGPWLGRDPLIRFIFEDAVRWYSEFHKEATGSPMNPTRVRHV